MQSTNIISSERTIVREAARRYRELGYTVLENPTGHELPEDLRGFHPDLIADNGEDYVVFEVKSAGKIRRSDYWQRLRTTIQNRPNRRLDISLNTAPDVEALTYEEITDLLARSKRVAESGSLQVALLSGWAALEASMRALLNHYNVRLSDYRPDTLLSTLQVEGLISDEDYEFVKMMRGRRSAIAHGMRATVGEDEIDRVFHIAEEMLSEAAENRETSFQ